MEHLSALVKDLVERFDSMEASLASLRPIEKQLAALRLEVQSWKAAGDAEQEELLGRVLVLEMAIAGMKR